MTTTFSKCRIFSVIAIGYFAGSSQADTTTVRVSGVPTAIAVNQTTNKIYVANVNSSDVTVIDGSNNSTIISATRIGSGTYSIAVNPATNQIYVGNGGDGTVTVINGSNNTATTVATAGSFGAIAFNSTTNKIYTVTNNGHDFSGTVTVIDGSNNATTMLPILVSDHPPSIAVNQVTNKVYVPGLRFEAGNPNAISTLTVINGFDNSVASVDLPNSTFTFTGGLAVNQVTNKIYQLGNQQGTDYFGAVRVIDGFSNSAIATLNGTTPRTYPAAVAINPVTNKIYVLNVGINNVTVIDGATNNTRTVGVGTQSLSYANPQLLAVNTMTNTIYVANSGSNDVTVIDGSNNTTTTVSAGLHPDAVAVNPMTNKIYVANASSSSVTVLDGPVTNIVPPAAPVGVIDTPAGNPTGITGAIGVTGWAVSNPAITKVSLWRDPVPSEPQGNLIYLTDTSQVPGARPDVAAAFPGYPQNDYGWGVQILTNELPNSVGPAGLGNGTYKVHAIATNSAGQTTDIGTKMIAADNSHAVLPFGTIDTPGIGTVASGRAYVNFGWALTPNPANVIPKDGSTITVFIDNKPVGHPVYNNNRSDIASLFPGLQNSNGAIGYYIIDTTTLTNGIHSISWVVSDNLGHAQGMGSRYFFVQN